MKRLEYADYAKALAIFLVVLGHTQGGYLPGRDWMYQDFCYAFHMPLFFVLAGFFVKAKAVYSAVGWRDFLRRNFLALMVPYFVWGIVYMPFSYANLGSLAYGSWLRLRDIGTLTSLWFLPAMFVGRVVCEAVHAIAWRLKVSDVGLSLLAVPLCFALGFLLPHHNAVGTDIGNVWQYDIGIMAAAYMMVGTLARPLLDRLARGPLAAALAVFIVSAGLFAAGFLLERPLLTAGKDMSMLMCNAEYGPWAWCLANALTGSAMTLAFAMLLARILPGNRALLFVGANTMGVYLIHKPLLAELLSVSARHGLPAEDLLTALPATCAAFLISLAIVMFFLRVAPTLFGKGMAKGLAAGDVLALAFGSDGALADVETKTLTELLGAFSRKVLADGKVDFAESEALLNFITPIAERRGGEYAVFRDQLLRAREDGKIDAQESAQLAEQLRKISATGLSGRRFHGVAAVLFCLLATLAAGRAEAVTVRPQATDEALVNPGMGWVFYKYSNRIWAYGVNTPTEDTLDWFPGCSTIYMRLTWNDLEPEEGDFRWEIIDSYAQPWIAKGKKIALRVMTCSQVEEGTPEFVRKAGAKGHAFVYRTKASKGIDFPPRWEPKYDDPVFLAKLENFLTAMAARYDGDPNVAFIDIGTLGIYGEGNPRDSYPLTDEERSQNGGIHFDRRTPPWKKRLVDIHIALWLKHFPRTQLIALDGFDGGWNADPDGETMKFCRENGIGFRDDSLFCFPPKGSQKNCPFEYWAHDGWARKFAPTLPVVLETGHCVSLQGTPKWSEADYLRAIEEHQASYVSIHDFPDEHLKRSRASIDAINRRLGYRFELREVTYPEAVTAGEKVEIASTWANVGVAPCLKGAALTWSLVDAKGNVAWTMVDNRFDFKSLEPTLGGVEKPRTVKTPCRFGFTKRIPEPDNVAVWSRKVGRTFPDTVVMLRPGTYTLCVSVGSRQGTPEIALPLKDGRSDRRYPIGTMTVR